MSPFLRSLLVIALFGWTLACGPSGEGTRSAAPAVEPTPPEILEPRAHVTPGGTGAVYFSIRNPGGEADRLTSIETAAARAAEMHETVEEDGVVRMVPHPEGFEIPAGSTVALEPGGKHVMLIEPRLEEGAATIPLTLHFERAGTLEVEAPLKEMGAMDHEGMDHEGMDHEGMDHEGMDP